MVIIGNGAAGNSAAEAFRSIDRETGITMISEEGEPEYSACVLYHYVSGAMNRSEVFLKDWEDYARMGVRALFGTTVLEVDPKEKVVVTGGGEIPYSRLIIATGSVPFVPRIGGLDKRGVFTFKTLRDADGIAQFHGGRIVVVGSGPIGVETCLSLRKRGCEVTLIEALDWVLPRILDREPAALMEGILRRYGIDLVTGEGVSQILGGERVTGIALEEGEIDCDMVILATGMRPNVDLAKRAGIEIGSTGGIVVDERMQTSEEEIYACGDCVETPDLLTDRKILSLQWSSAVTQGKIAGYNCAGRPRVYEGSLNMVTLDLHETFMASIGWTTATYPRPSKLDIVEHEGGGDYWRLLVDGGRVVGVQFIGRSWRTLDAVVLSMLKHIDLEEARKSIERGLMMAEPWRVKLQSFLR